MDDIRIGSATFPGIEDDTTIVEGIILLKGLDANGDIVYYQRVSQGLTAPERVGMLDSALHLERNHHLSHFQPLPGDDSE